MDIATILGIVGGFGVLFGAIIIGGDGLTPYIDIPSIIIVGGGSVTAVLIRYPIGRFISALTLGLKVSLIYKSQKPADLIDELANLAEVVRKEGPLGLEKVQPSNPFLAKGVQMIADGFNVDAIRNSLERERDLEHERLQEGHKIYKALGEASPAFGMVGTLIGLVAMFGHMDDPKKIGPGMAVALLTTFYGAIIANIFALPISDKMANRAEEQATNNSMIIDAILMIRENKSPSLIAEELLSYLPLHSRDSQREAA